MVRESAFLQFSNSLIFKGFPQSGLLVDNSVSDTLFFYIFHSISTCYAINNCLCMSGENIDIPVQDSSESINIMLT